MYKWFLGRDNTSPIDIALINDIIAILCNIDKRHHGSSGNDYHVYINWHNTCMYDCIYTLLYMSICLNVYT